MKNRSLSFSRNFNALTPPHPPNSFAARGNSLKILPRRLLSTKTMRRASSEKLNCQLVMMTIKEINYLLRNDTKDRHCDSEEEWSRLSSRDKTICSNLCNFIYSSDNSLAYRPEELYLPILSFC